METRVEEYNGHKITIRPQTSSLQNARAMLHNPIPELLIDGKIIRYERLNGGLYSLPIYAYDWQPDLMSLAKRFLDYQIKTKSQPSISRISAVSSTATQSI